MQHLSSVTGQGMPDVTGAARAQLTGIVESIDARFTEVGALLADAVAAIDAIVAALQDGTSVFQEGDAARAVDDLTAAARALCDVTVQVEQRAEEVAHVRQASHSLSGQVEDVQKTLGALQIFGMNVKIAASGMAEFIDFANRMNEKLKAGEVQTGGFHVKLAELEGSLARMKHCDGLLASECRKIVPQVPDRLVENADALRSHQHKLVELAGRISALARSIQGNVAAILGALQVGDMARQRLEHVLTGCTLLEAYLASSKAGQDERNEARSHMVRLLIAHTEETAADFRRETELLLASLRRLEPETGRLMTLQQRDDGDGDDGRIFLRRLEGGIAEAAAMVAQLQQADRQAEETLRAIVDTVDDLSSRAKHIRELRIDVQQMAINIALKCRRVEAIGRPVTVVANEIRGCSDRLHETCGSISSWVDKLNAVSGRMREQVQAEPDGEGSDLSRSLKAIRESAACTESAMAAAEQKSDGMADMLARTAEALERSIDLGAAINGVATLLADCAGPEAAVSERADHPVRMLLDEMARIYTMASERAIHDRFLLPGMVALKGIPASQGLQPAGAEDDDALFDDALF